MIEANNVPFRRVYEKLALRGACDEVGSTEYFRVLQEWVCAGFPPDIASFIMLHANSIDSIFPLDRELVRLALGELDKGLHDSAMPMEHMRMAFKILTRALNPEPTAKPAKGGAS